MRPFADVERISCTSAAGCDYHLDFDNRGEYWTVHDDVLLPDPMGHAPGRSFVLPDGLTQAQATFGTDLTGAFMGTTIEADVYLDPDTTLGLELRVTDAIWTSYGAAVWVGPDSVWAADELGVGLSRPGDMVGIDRPPGRYHVELLVDEVNGLRVRLRSWDGSYVREAGTRLVLGAFRPAPSLELGIIARRAAGTTGQLVVESITVHRDALDPCSHPAPSTRSPAGFFSNRGVARMQDGAICVAGWSNLPSPAVESGLFARSTDEGATWTYTPIDTGHLGFQGAWREPDRALHLAVASADGTWFWATTTDCVTISDVTSTFGASGRTAIGYGLVEDHRARVVTYEFEDGTHYVYQSLADEGPTLREVDLGRVPRTAGTFFRPATATFAGNDVVIAYPELDYTIGVVSHGVRHETVVRPFLPFTRSGRSGACDAQSLTVEGVVVEIDERPAIAGVAATGSVYYPCAAPGERPGVVRDTFTIRAPR